jgi:hypothetical protein
MVTATSSDRKAPAQLGTAESATANLGPGAFVAIEVAMALAMPWKPLVESITNAHVPSPFPRFWLPWRRVSAPLMTAETHIPPRLGQSLQQASQGPLEGSHHGPGLHPSF